MNDQRNEKLIREDALDASVNLESKEFPCIEYNEETCCNVRQCFFFPPFPTHTLGSSDTSHETNTGL